MEGPTGEERTAPTSSTRVLGARSGQSSPSRPEHRPGKSTGQNAEAQRGAAPCGSPPAHGAGEPRKRPRARPPGDRGPKAGPNELTMAGGAVPSRQRVVALQPDPGWAITWGRGEGTQAAAAAALAPRSLSPAPPRACYINRRGTMSPNFVVGI